MADSQLKAVTEAEIESNLMAAIQAHEAQEANGTTTFPTTSRPYPSIDSLPEMAIPELPDFTFGANQVAPHGPASPATKRRLDPDSSHERPAKQLKTGSATDMAAPELDLEAMLESALASHFDAQHMANLPTSGPVPIQIQAPAPSEDRTFTATPGPDKVEDRIMKASGNSRRMIRSMSLPLLGNLAVQLLLRLAQQSRLETQNLIADQGSDFSKDYLSLTSMFIPARMIFSGSALIFPDDLDIPIDSDDRETIRMSNLASIAVSFFGSKNIPFTDIHKWFSSIFIPEDGDYDGSLTDLLVGLKTQVFVDRLSETEEPAHVAALLDEIFPADHDKMLLTLRDREGSVSLNPTEQLLGTRIRERRELLLKSLHNAQIKGQLSNLYPLSQFDEILSTFLHGHLAIVVDYADKFGVNMPLSQETSAPAVKIEPNGIEQYDLASVVKSAVSSLVPASGMHETAMPDGFLTGGPNTLVGGTDLAGMIGQAIKEEAPDRTGSGNTHEPVATTDIAALISESLADAMGKLPDTETNLTGLHLNGENSASQSSYPTHTSNVAPSANHPYTTTNTSKQLAALRERELPPDQSSPTSVLYERARQAAVAKSSNTARREGIHSTRRPWSSEEEKTLMLGLDMVKGPHWSQILSLFGPNGTISDILKDRTQVQLKDKARNLKLFFLKTNSEVPFYLRSVTGELKTRAPSQAARKEAEEKARQNQEEEKQRFQGLMALSSIQEAHRHPTNGAAAGMPQGRAGTTTPGLGTPNRAMTSSTPVPPVPIPSLPKAEPPDHHVLHQTVKIQPTLAPAPAPIPVPASVASLVSMHMPSRPQVSPQQPCQTPAHRQAALQTAYQVSQAGQPQAQGQAQKQAQGQAQGQRQGSETNGQHQIHGLPSIPPNHHSTLEEASVEETLLAALAGSTAGSAGDDSIN